MAVAHHRLFDLQRSIFRHGQFAYDHGTDRRTTRLTEQQRGLRVDVNKYLFDGDLCGLIGVYHLKNAINNGFQAAGQVFYLRALASSGFDGAAGDVVQFFAKFFDDPKPCQPQAGVNS